MRICGIDPGKQGALAFADLDPVTGAASNVAVYDMPLSDEVNGTVQPCEIAIFKIMQAERPDLAVIEEVGPRPRSSAMTEWRFSTGIGALRAAVRLHMLAARGGNATHYVRPDAWKRALKLDSDKSKSLAAARAAFPALRSSLSRAKDDGRAEALLLIDYYRRVLMPRGNEGIEVC